MTENERAKIKLPNNAPAPTIPEDQLRVSEAWRRAADRLAGRSLTVKATKMPAMAVGDFSDDGPPATLSETPCPSCGEMALTIEYRLEVKELGTWSLAGTQPKVAARSWPWLRCLNCGVEARAES